MTTLQAINASASPERQTNENFETLSAAAIFGKRQPVTAGLNWGYYGGLYNGNTVPDGVVTLTDNATNYVVVLRSSGVVSASTNSANSVNPLYAKLYSATTLGGSVIAVIDQRTDSNGLLLGGSGGASAGTELKGLTFTSDTTSTADSDPGNGKLKWNNATQASSTVLFFDDQTADGVSLTTFWASLGSAGFIYLQQADDASKWQLWKWTALPVNGTGYRKFTSALQASGGAIATGKTVDCDIHGIGVAWGGISGTLASQTDLQTALDGKAQDRRTVTVVTPASGVANIDCSLGDYFTLALTANIASITFSNPPGSGKGASLMVRVTQDTTPRTVTWPSSFRWEGSAPAVSTGSSAVDLLAITSFDNGTKWDATLSKARV